MISMVDSPIWVVALGIALSTILDAAGVLFFPFGAALSVVLAVFLKSTHQRRDVARQEQANRLGGPHVTEYERMFRWEIAMEDRLNSPGGKIAAILLSLACVLIAASG